MGILAAIKYREGKQRMANTEETNGNIIHPNADDICFIIKEEVCSETDSSPLSPVNGSVNNEQENHNIENDNHDKPSEISADNDVNDSDSLKIDEENTHAANDNNDDRPVDYSQKGFKTSSKSEVEPIKTITNKSLPFSPFMSGLKVGMHAIPLSGGILYQSPDQLPFVSPLLYSASDGKQMRPFKAYNTARELMSGLPSLAAYAIPVGGKIHGSSPIPIRANAKNTPSSQVSTNGTAVTPPSTHLMTLATEADKLRQRECENDDDENDKNEDGLSEDGMTSDGNDSYKDDINEFYPQGLQDTQKKKGKKRKCSLEEQMKDNTYWERRRKNNEAAKRSRDARRAKEDQIAIRAALLEQENMRLRIELAALKEEMIKLRGNVYGKNGKSS